MSRAARTLRRGAALFLCLALGVATVGCTSTSHDCGRRGTDSVGDDDGGIFDSIIEGFFKGLFGIDDDDDDDCCDDGAEKAPSWVPGRRDHQDHEDHIHVPGQRRCP